jgi:hypothetical protein
MTITLLMPATIDPGGIVLTARADPAVRLADHLAALERWIAARSFTRIVWCENSGWPLERISPLAGQAKDAGIDLELIGFRGQDFTPALGKGYGEMGILAHAFAHSRLLAEGGHVCKASARYFVRNASVLRRAFEAAEPPDVCCDLKKDLTVADSRWFGGSAAFFRTHLLPLRTMINDSAGIYFEHALARAATAALGAGMRWALPASLPRITGITGSTDLPIRLSASKVLRHRLKRALFAY